MVTWGVAVSTLLVSVLCEQAVVQPADGCRWLGVLLALQINHDLIGQVSLQEHLCLQRAPLAGKKACPE